MQIKRNKLEHLCWILVLFILFFQSVLQNYSIISNVALLLIAIQQYPRMDYEKKRYLAMMLVWILFLIAYSMLLGNDVGLAVRFGLIVLFVISAYLWKIEYNVFVKTLFWISFMLVIGLICLEIYMFTLSESEYMFLRDQFFQANEMGDVFWWDVYYKLELRGTPLIVFVYMLSYVIDIFPSKYKKTIRGLYFIATIFAGNFAYQLALVLFHLVYYIQSSLRTPKLFIKRVFWLSVFSIIIGGVLVAYISSQMETKKGGSAQARVDQAEVLFNDMAENPITLFLGSGLGHTIDVKTQVRDYRRATYFEVQTLYVFNQLGLINFTILVLANLFLTFKYIRKKELVIVYGVYVAYASTNPYIWDTNHVVVITALLCAKSHMITNMCLYPKRAKVMA